MLEPWAQKAAIEYLGGLSEPDIKSQEYTLNKLITENLSKISKVRIIGPAGPESRGNIVNFIIEGMEMQAVAELLDKTNNIMVRSGMHCAHPWFNSRGLPASLRVSVYFYNTTEEAEIFIQTLEKIIRYF